MPENLCARIRENFWSKDFRANFSDMECRSNCAACCIIPSISSPIPGMPDGKPAFVPCIHLDDQLQCEIFDLPERPKVCSDFKAEKLVCGSSREEAIVVLSELENH